MEEGQQYMVDWIAIHGEVDNNPRRSGQQSKEKRQQCKEETIAIHETTWGLDLTPEMSQVDQRSFVSGFAEYQGFKTLTVLQISVEIFYKTTVNHCGLNGGQFIWA